MSEWPMVKLGELLKPSPKKTAGELDAPILSITMHDGLVEQGTRFKKRIASLDTSIYRIVFKGQLVVGFPIDEGVLDFQDKYSQALVCPAYGVWDLVSDEVTPEFLGLFLKSPRAISIYKSRLRGTTARRRSLPTKVFQEIEFPLPPLGEQKRIAEILGQTTKAISSVQNQIEQVKKLRSSIVSTASKIAVELRALSEYFDINPRQPRNIPDNAPTSFVPMANLDETFGISPIASQFSKHKKGYTYFENGDILLAKIIPCFENGKSAIAKLSTQIGHGSTEFHVLRHKNHMHQDVCLSPLLVAAILKQPSFLKPAENFMRGSAGQKRIPASYIASLKVPVLKSVDLEQIDQSLELVEALLNLYHRKLSLLQELQKSLANRAFAGLL